MDMTPNKDSKMEARERIRQLEGEVEGLRQALNTQTSAHSIAGVPYFLLHIGQNGQIVYMNTPCVEYFGFQKRSVVGKPVSILQKSNRLAMANLIAGCQPGGDLNQDLCDEHGRRYQVNITWKHGEGYVVAEDISDRAILRSYVSRYIREGLDGLDDTDLSTFRLPERRFMSVSFTDLRGFTAMSETLPPDEVRSMINSYFEAMIRAVETNKATVDKIVGDEVMALYGAPKYFKDHALRAVITAQEQQKYLRLLQADLRRAGKKMPGCGAGINTGEMVLGNIGTEVRQDYTVIGSSVNIAAKLCEAARENQILLTEGTLNEILDNLPDGWQSSRVVAEPVALPSGAALHGMSELSGELAGLKYRIGPADRPCFEFRYLFTFTVRGSELPIPVIEAVSLDSELSQAEALSDEIRENTPERIFGKYRLLELAGRGGMAEVWRASDPFGNEVAIKMLIAGEGANEDQIKRFLREAELMRNLDHRHICRIFEVGIYEKIHYIAMEHLKGVPLDRLISGGPAESDTTIDEIVSRIEKSLSVHQSAPPAPESKESSVSFDALPRRPLREQHSLALMKGILEGIQFAHERGIIHRDLKPGNIMIKRSGDPVIMDFGLGRFESSQHSMTVGSQMVGTLEFMAPEQARSALQAEERSDVFSAGAVLYYMLTGRKWFQSTGNILLDSARLIAQEVVPLRRIQSRIPRDLETIVLKSMEKEPERRYPSAKAFLEDLNRYQRNEPISARPASVIYRLTRKARRHRVPVISVAAALVVGSALGLALFGEKLKQYASWGRPILIEDFSDSSWQDRWLVQRGRFEIEKGRLVTMRGKGDHFAALYRRELFGSVAMGFEGEMLPDSQPGDLSIVWAGDTIRDKSGYDFQTGGSDNQFYQIGERGSMIELARIRRINKPGTVYKIRAEIEGGWLRLLVNGRKILEYYEFFPVSAGYLGLFGYYPGKAFDNVKIYSKQVPEQVSVLAIGDNYYLHRRYEDAKREYGLVVRSHANGPTGQMALFKRGLACYKLGEYDEVRAITKLLAKSPLRIEAGFLLCEVLRTTGEHEKVATVLKNLCAMAGKREMPQLKMRISSHIASGLSAAPPLANTDIEKFVRLYQRLFPGDQDYASTIARALNHLGHCEEVLRDYPGEREECAIALYNLGRFGELIAKYPDRKWHVANAMNMQNRNEEVLALFPSEEHIRARALTAMGRFNEVLAKYPFQAKSVYMAQGRFEDILKLEPDRWYTPAALIELGRIEEYLNFWRNRGGSIEINENVMHLLAFEAFLRRDAGPDTLEKVPFTATTFPHFRHFILPGFLRFLESGADLETEYASIFRDGRFDYAQQLWYAASFICGRIDEKEFRLQPAQIWVESNFLLYSGMRCEAQRDTTGAITAYRQYLEFPRWRQPFDPVAKRFAQWRQKTLLGRKAKHSPAK